jgi:hypothetical protein
METRVTGTFRICDIGSSARETEKILQRNKCSPKKCQVDRDRVLAKELALLNEYESVEAYFQGDMSSRKYRQLCF